MADVTNVNGDMNDGVAEDFYDPGQTEGNSGIKVAELNQTIEELQNEKQNIMSENLEIKERVKKLTIVIEELRGNDTEMKQTIGDMRREIDQSDEDKKILESIESRAVELESEVSKLQLELIAALNEGDEATAEVAELKNALGDKGVQLEGLERDMENMKKDKTDSEKKVRELERRIGVLEVKLTEERSKRVRVEEEMRERIDEKERELNGWKKKEVDLESELAKNGVEMNKLKSEKKEMEKALKESEDKAKALDLKMIQLQNNVEEAEKLVGGLKERTIRAVNGNANEMEGTIDEENEGCKYLWPVIAGSTGVAVLVAAAMYASHSKRR